MPVNKKILNALAVGSIGLGTGTLGYRAGNRHGLKVGVNAGIKETLNTLGFNPYDTSKKENLNKIAEDAFLNELTKLEGLNKTAVDFSAIGKTIKDTLKTTVYPIAKSHINTLKGSFKNLGNAGKDFKSAYNSNKHGYNSRDHINNAIINLSNSKAAIGTTIVGAKLLSKLIKKIKSKPVEPEIEYYQAPYFYNE